MSGKLCCGAAKCDITPDDALLPFMFGLMDRKYAKVRDRLYLRVLVFGDDTDKVMFVVYDLDKAPFPEEWTLKIAEACDMKAVNIIYTAIHTHCAPLTGYRPFEGPNFIKKKPQDVQEKVAEYEDFLMKRLIRTAKEACENMVPARIGHGTARCDIGVSRNQDYYRKNEDGSITHIIALGARAEGTVDHTQFVLRAERADNGEPIAFLLNYPVHCVAAFLNDCGDDRSFLSADIAGEVSRTLEKEYAGSVALWTSGAAGDINPVQMIQCCIPDPDTGEPVERLVKGEDAADANIVTMASRQLQSVRKALRETRCGTDEAALSAAEDFVRTKCKHGPIGKDTAVCDEDYIIRTHLIRVGDIAFIGIDGELFTNLALAMKEASPCQNTFIINHDSSLRMDNPGYIADDEMLARVKETDGNGRGPGSRCYTAPGTVKEGLVQSTQKLFSMI